VSLDSPAETLIRRSPVFKNMGAGGKVLTVGEQLFSSEVVQRLGLPIFSYVLILFFLIQGPVFFPDQWDHWETVTLIYSMFLVPGLIMSFVGGIAVPAWKVLLWFSGVGAGGFFLFKLLLAGAKPDYGFPVGGLLPTLVFQAFVIVMAEESFFRGFLLEIGKSRVGVGILLSSAMFSVFHLAAYSIAGLNFVAFGVAFIMGLAFGFIYLATREFAGLGIVLGLHLAYNAALLFG
jgi:membrane protease YdiL (CAAX protease family)